MSVVVAAIPILVAAIRAPLTGWLPTLDNGFVTVRAVDVFTRHPPLLGMWSSASTWSHVQVNLPGPLEFELLAVPVRLFGPIFGTTVGMGLVHIAAIVALAILVRRRGGPLLGVVAMVFVVSLEWSMGSEFLYDPWPINSAPFIFLLFVVAAWSVADGDLVALPILGFGASYLVQTHLSYVILVPAIGVAGVAGLGVVMWRRRRDAPQEWPAAKRRLLIWAAASAGLVVVLWLPPIFQQLTGHPGNVTQLVKAAGKPAPLKPTPTDASTIVGSTVALPPWWLPPSYGHPRFDVYAHGPSLTESILGLVLMILAGAALAGVAFRRRDRTTVSLLAVAAVTLAAALITAYKTPNAYGFSPNYLRWLWGVSMLCWFALAAAFIRSVGPALLARAGRSLAMGALGATIALAGLALPRADRGVFPQRGAAIARQLMAHGRGRLASLGPLLVRADSVFLLAGEVAPVVLVDLQRHGIGFVFDDEELVHQLGAARRWNGRNARTVLRIDGETEPLPGYHRVASYYGLRPSEQAELVRLTTKLRAWLTTTGGPHLNAFGKRFAESSLLVAGGWAEVASLAGNPDALLTDKNFRTLVQGNFTLHGQHGFIIDVSSIGERDVTRWAELQERALTERVALDVDPTAGPAR